MGSWSEFLTQEQDKEYFKALSAFVATERANGKTVYPKEEDVFQAFELTPLDQVKVVILGQDPYHGPDQAHGLCFSVQPGVKIPPSLRNIFKELAADIPSFTVPSHGCLVDWAEQGILMLNTVLTVEQGKAHSHAKAGWETFSDNVIAFLNNRPQPIIFVLWGNHAQKKGLHIDESRHQILTSVHPSPLSARRGFFGGHHFSTINKMLEQRGETPIDWQLSEY